MKANRGSVQTSSQPFGINGFLSTQGQPFESQPFESRFIGFFLSPQGALGLLVHPSVQKKDFCGGDGYLGKKKLVENLA